MSTVTAVGLNLQQYEPESSVYFAYFQMPILQANVAKIALHLCFVTFLDQFMQNQNIKTVSHYPKIVNIEKIVAFFGQFCKQK
jgi:hypothetical protein